MYKQTQGRNSFRKTGEGITSNLTGVNPDPPTKVDATKLTKESLESRLKQVGENITQGKAKPEHSGQQMQRLYNIASGNNAQKNYNLYRQDSITAAGNPENRYYNSAQGKMIGQMVSDTSKGFFDDVLKNK